MRTLDNLHEKPEEHGAALKELAGHYHSRIDDLHKQLELYAEAFSALLSAMDKGAVPGKLAGLRHGTVEDLHRQIELYAEAFSALLSAMDEGAARIGGKPRSAASPLSEKQSC